VRDILDKMIVELESKSVIKRKINKLDYAQKLFEITYIISENLKCYNKTTIEQMSGYDYLGCQCCNTKCRKALYGKSAIFETDYTFEYRALLSRQLTNVETLKKENYVLKSGLIHLGTKDFHGDFGHWTAFRYDESRKCYYYCDDSRIVSLSKAELKKLLENKERTLRLVHYVLEEKK
jgi:hypothetical protein